jgi:AAA domain
MNVETAVLKSRCGDAAPCDRYQLPDHPASWWCDPKNIPPRLFLLRRHYKRGTAGGTIGASDLETKLALIEAVSMAVGRDLLTGTSIDGPLRVMHLNAENGQDDLDRQVAAICLHHGLSQADLGDRLFVHSVRDRPLRIVTLNGSHYEVNETIIEWLEHFILKNAIDAVQIIPLVSFHAVCESDNTDMDVVIKEGLGAIAGRTHCAMEIFHQPGKSRSNGTVTTVADARGASAIVNPMHSIRVISVMSAKEATKFLVSRDERELYVKVSNSKVDARQVGEPIWLKLDSVVLPSGDQVVCAVSWSPPGPAETATAQQMAQFRNLVQGGLYSKDERSPQWIGHAIAAVLKIDLSAGNPRALAKVKAIIEAVESKDGKRRKRAGKRGDDHSGVEIAKSRAAPKRTRQRATT